MKRIKSILVAVLLAITAIHSHAATGTPHVPDSFLYDVISGNIVKTDTFKCGLTTSAYTYNRATHTKRSDITNEVTGTGYTAGGQTVTSFVATNDTTNHKLSIVVTPAVWSGSTTITARNLFCYKSRGGAASADELVLIDNFSADVSSSGGTFTVSPITLEYTHF